MKRISLLLLMLLALPGMLLAQETVTVHALNIAQTAPNAVEWDIYMQRTSAGWDQLATHQYIFTFNTAIKDPLGILYFTFVPATSDLSNSSQTPNQSRFSISGNQLRISSPAPPGAGNGSLISNVYPGTRVIRVRLVSTNAAAGAGTAVPFESQLFNIAWKTSGTPPNSQVNGYVGGTTNAILTSTFTAFGSNPLLPVELTSFTARYNGKSVDLKWATATESNNAGFDVLRSTDPSSDENWEQIGFVEGNGTSNVPHTYVFEDAGAPQAGVVYYRLRQVDRDGKMNMSNTVLVKIGTIDGFQLHANYPNPFTGSTSISFTLPEDRFVSIKAYDMTGRQVKETIEGNMGAGFNTLTFDASGLQPGNYRYVVTAGTAVQSAMMTIAK